MNPQIFGVLMDELLAEGALDVFYTPIQMKKNRPGTLLTVIAPPDSARAPDRDDLPGDDDHRRALSRDDARVPRSRDDDRDDDRWDRSASRWRAATARS